MHCLEAGEPGRPCVLMLHGFPELSYSWRKVMPALADAGPKAFVAIAAQRADFLAQPPAKQAEMMKLIDRFAELAANALEGGLHPDALATGSALVSAWNEPHRRYHSVAHLLDILVRVDQLAAYADDPDAVRLAAWYHDCIYAGLPDDEERSARRAEEDLSRLDVAPSMLDQPFWPLEDCHW